jgi:hypothetical protein
MRMFRLKLINITFSKNPFDLDWGSISSDGYNETEKLALNVFNFDISSVDKIDRCIVFCVGKVVWLNKHLPQGTTQKVVFDLRGQPLPFLDRAKRIKDEILKIIQAKDPKVVLNIEILI